MRNFLNEYFYVPERGKIREKVMMTRLVMTITFVIVCLAAMSITAYAYFSYNVTSASNIIKAANFETSVEIQITNSAGKSVDTPKPITTNYRLYKIAGLKAGEWYTVTVTPTKRSTAKTGFVVVSADKCSNTYYTQQLAKDVNAEGGQTTSLSFELMITDTTDVYLLAHWGTSSYYDAYKNKGDQEELYITQGEKIKLLIDGKDINKDDDGSGDEGKNGTTQTDTSTPPVTEKTPSTSKTPAPSTSVTTPPTSSEASDPTESTTETTTPSQQTEPLENTQSQEATETRSTDETTDASIPEANS